MTIMKTIEKKDKDHVGHEFYATETIYDNPVEVSTWAHCVTCNVEFMLNWTEIEYGGYDLDDFVLPGMETNYKEES